MPVGSSELVLLLVDDGILLCDIRVFLLRARRRPRVITTVYTRGLHRTRSSLIRPDFVLQRAVSTA
jgi:hypothetical protein